MCRRSNGSSNRFKQEFRSPGRDLNTFACPWASHGRCNVPVEVSLIKALKKFMYVQTKLIFTVTIKFFKPEPRKCPARHFLMLQF